MTEKNSIVLIMFASSLITVQCFPQNNSDALITNYAKVTRWGTKQNNTVTGSSEGRSHSGQSFWTQRSKVNINGVKAKKPPIAYQYSISKKIFKDENKKETVPGIGEVIIDRFNPRPYFQYDPVPPKTQNVDTSSGNSFPVYKPEASQTPIDLYTSPYTSYNPPKKPFTASDISDYPPNRPQRLPPPPPPPPTSTKDSYAAPPSDSFEDGIYDYKPNSKIEPSLGPPLAPSDSSQSNNDDDKPPKNMALSDDMPQNMPDSNGPPIHDPKNEDDIYYPPDSTDHEETNMEHTPPEINMDHHSPPEMNLEHPPAGYKPDMGEDDLFPPPSFPQYLYDHHPYTFDHHHHQIYEEVKHPTTTPQAEDERVNKGHYSYYYLGRKLWYIPLYFSVYFIIYVTVLILKSIARHKIEFKQHFERKSRQLGGDDGIAELQRNITEGIENVRKKYQYMAM